MASVPSLAYQEQKKDEITDKLTNMFDVLRTFNETIAAQFKDDEKLDYPPAIAQKD